MRRIFADDKQFESQLNEIRSRFEPLGIWFRNQEKIEAVNGIIKEVYNRGNGAVCEMTSRFDGVDLAPDGLKISGEEIEDAYKSIDIDLKSSIQIAIDNVRRYQEHIKVYQQSSLKDEGIELTTWYQPLGRIGICVPGASAALPSTVIMSAVPAQVAGVKNIVVVSPPRWNGSIHPVVLASCRMLGIEEVYRIGGSQAVAAIAIGTESIKPVDKIVGPGNIYVQLAKKLLFGVVDIDSFAGPSEIVVLAESSTNPTFAAADLIGQAEHDPGSAILITPDESLANKVEEEIESILSDFSRAEQTRRCIEEFSAIIITKDLSQAIETVNRIAPEHLSVQTQNYDADAARCTNAGAIFVGPFTSEAVGDYVAGPSHVLPTGGTARFFSPLNVMDFIRHTSVIKYSREALVKVYPAIEKLTGAEMLPGHQLSAKLRLEQE